MSGMSLHLKTFGRQCARMSIKGLEPTPTPLGRLTREPGDLFATGTPTGVNCVCTWSLLLRGNTVLISLPRFCLRVATSSQFLELRQSHVGRGCDGQQNSNNEKLPVHFNMVYSCLGHFEGWLGLQFRVRP